MTLPASGQISFYDINIELRGSGSATSTIGLDEAESGVYATINQCSSPYPSTSRPANITEWYSYNHAAASSLVYAGGFDYSATSCATACGLAVNCSTVLYYNTAATAVFTNNVCNTFPSVGYYADCARGNCYDIGSSGVVNSITACATTTTTTTTTTAACSANGASCPENDGEFSPTCCSGNCCSNICTANSC